MGNEDKEDSTLDIDAITDYGGTTALKNALKAIDFQKLRKIQARAIRNGLFNNISLFICSPSGSGKTLIGEMAAINNILTEKRKSLYIVPLRALAGEKYNQFHENYSYLGVETVMAVGDQQVEHRRLQNADLLIMTFEKFDSYMRNLKENKWIYDIKTVVTDEIHIIGEKGRGPRLETLLLRLFLRLKEIQLIALSATVANPKEIAAWFENLSEQFAEREFKLIFSEKRPVELDYGMIPTNNKLTSIHELVEKTLTEGGQILVFTNSRRDTERTAAKLMELTKRYVMEDDREGFKTVLRGLRTADQKARLDFKNSLFDLLKAGVAYHHAGLESQYRFLVEKMFRMGCIKVIVCTTTLSAGINTPARLVILKEHEIFSKKLTKDENGKVKKTYFKRPIDRNVFHQILGRAGRPGYDNVGLCRILVRDQSEAIKCQDYYFKNRASTDDDSNMEKKKGSFVPKYDRVSSKLDTLNNLIEFILLSINEQSELNINQLYELVNYSYLIDAETNSTMMKSLLFDIVDAEIFQLLKVYADTSDIVEAERSPLQSELLEVHTDRIRGSVYHTDMDIKFNVVFDKKKGTFCGCKKLFQKRDKAKLDKPSFKFCKHQVVFLKYLIRWIENHDFILVRKNERSLADSLSSRIPQMDTHHPEIKSAADLIVDDLEDDDSNTVTKIFTENSDLFNGSELRVRISRLNAKHLIEKTINHAIRNENIVDFLIKNKLTGIKHINIDGSDKTDHSGDEMQKGTRVRDERLGNQVLEIPADSDYDADYEHISFYSTELGKSILKNYVYPNTGLLFRKKLNEAVKNLKEEDFTREEQNQEQENSEISEAVRKKAAQIAVELIESEGRYTPLYSEEIILLRVSGHSYEDIYSKVARKKKEEGRGGRLYLVDIRNYLEFASRIARFMDDFTKVLLKTEVNAFTFDEMQILALFSNHLGNLHKKLEPDTIRI